ncbi:MAG: hypothetical protein IRZ16_10485 [Myxococcaceae bacterium]|nr:hypothetical protein [Myxococcaceae bacterium]
MLAPAETAADRSTVAAAAGSATESETVAAAFVAGPAPSDAERAAQAEPGTHAVAPNDPGTPAARDGDAEADGAGAIGQHFLFAGGGLVVLALIVVVVRRRRPLSVPHD